MYFNLTPFYRNHGAPVARLFDTLFAEPSLGTANSYPPYHVARLGDNKYRLTLAVAGFGKKEIAIEAREGELVIRGEKAEKDTDDGGIAPSNFERRFQLADNLHVSRADLQDGLLQVDCERQIPQAEQFRSIPLNKAVN